MGCALSHAGHKDAVVWSSFHTRRNRHTQTQTHTHAPNTNAHTHTDTQTHTDTYQLDKNIRRIDAYIHTHT
jgi:predicted PolB exonuclease-like 3'-5' exonuclease